MKAISISLFLTFSFGVALTVPMRGAPGAGSKVRMAGNERLRSLHPELRRVVVDAEHLPEVVRRGGRYLAMVSDNDALVSVPAVSGIWGSRSVSADSKLSVALSTAGNYVVVFHPDVKGEDAQHILNRVGITQFPKADLLPNHYLVSGNGEQANALSLWEEVAYIFPASDEMYGGTALYSCAGPLTDFGPIGQYIVTFGDGWDGPGRGRADLTYSLSALTSKLHSMVIETAVEKAAAEWGRVVGVRFSASTVTTGPRNVNVLFGSSAHGDSYPFDGQGRVLAHTFYPPPVNTEPIAGDIHLDDDEMWGNGGEVDLYSVVLHEFGHALGLGHSDRPNSVMYPYYRSLSTLQDDDIAAIQRLYDSPVLGTPAPSIPGQITLAVEVPANVTQGTVDLVGTIGGGVGDAQVKWTLGGSGGTAEGGRNWVARSIPLVMGANWVRLEAHDSGGASASRSVLVIRTDLTTESAAAPTPAPAPVPPPPPPTSGPDTSPPALAVTTPRLSISATTAGTARVGGAARDDVGVTSVTWTSVGRSGTASGTSTWEFDVPLYVGDNSIVVRATDAAGNFSWRSLTITRR